jgi:hypothetical protein
MVNNLTGCGSVPHTLNLSTQNQDENVSPDCGGNTLSPKEKQEITETSNNGKCNHSNWNKINTPNLTIMINLYNNFF